MICLDRSSSLNKVLHLSSMINFKIIILVFQKLLMDRTLLLLTHLLKLSKINLRSVPPDLNLPTLTNPLLPMFPQQLPNSQVRYFHKLIINSAISKSLNFPITWIIMIYSLVSNKTLNLISNYQEKNDKMLNSISFPDNLKINNFLLKPIFL